MAAAVSAMLVAPNMHAAPVYARHRSSSSRVSVSSKHCRYVGNRNSSLVGKALRASTTSRLGHVSRVPRQQPQPVKASMDTATKETAEDGDLVKVHFVGKLEDGSVFEDTNTRGTPISFKIGADEIMTGMENAVRTMKVGEKLTVTVPPAEAFGEYDEDNCFEVPIERAPEGLTLGHVRLFEGPATARVTKITETDFTLDCNHELAGKTVTFELNLVEVVDPAARFPLKKSEAEWKAQLPAFAYQVLRQKGTEPGGTGEYDKFYPEKGYFVCGGCEQPLYSAAAKFNSGCGWPAFDKCFKDSVVIEVDNSSGMQRIEIMCSNCGGHLGHVFEGEGMTQTNERHCVNSISVKYVDAAIPDALVETPVLE